MTLIEQFLQRGIIDVDALRAISMRKFSQREIFTYSNSVSLIIHNLSSNISRKN